MGQSDLATLKVTVTGYAFTANWRYISVLPGTTVNISDWIKALLADCEFLTAGSIHANTLQVVENLTTPQRVWDKLIELLGLGDAAGNPWRLYVDQGRKLNYEPVDNKPAYHLRNGNLVSLAGENTDQVDPWRIKPSVVRDMDYPVKRNELGAWLLDARDFYVNEVEVSMATGVPTLKTELFSENDILTAQDHYRKTLEQLAKKDTQTSSPGSPAVNSQKSAEKKGTPTTTWTPPKAKPGATKQT
jgi:hypothetical protein